MARILNRVVEWDEDGIKYEPDQRHAEITVKMLGLKEEKTKGVGTPGIRVKRKEGSEDRKLKSEQGTMYRALVARGNYLAQDRTDIQFAVKELARKMSDPTEDDWTALKRLGRYLLNNERYVQKFEYQGDIEDVTVWTDTDYAGCLRTRKSTSGGIVQLGQHTIKGWSTTQSVVALSSGEAEYYGMVRGAAVGLGIKAVMEDLGVGRGIRVKTDASAAYGIAHRMGLGKVRHLETCQLWLQQKVGNGETQVEKVKGEDNLADALTKHIAAEELHKHMVGAGGEAPGGRHQLAPQSDANQ